MELKYEDIQRLLTVEKCVDANILHNNALTLSLDFPVQKEIRLFSAMGDTEFRWVINQSGRVSFKITLFVMEKDNNLGILRLDYVPHSKFHLNPLIGEEIIPDFLKEYAGKEIRGNHVHFAVPGCKELIWAIPLSRVHNFPETFDGQQCSLPDIVDSFAKHINISTQIRYETPVL